MSIQTQSSDTFGWDQFARSGADVVLAVVLNELWDGRESRILLFQTVALGRTKNGRMEGSLGCAGTKGQNCQIRRRVNTNSTQYLKLNVKQPGLAALSRTRKPPSII